ncbi:polyprenyl diphosphate synthase [Kitasatospora sp. NPDC101801]|uniref:polyprenyl diphosphate synthase n=1 Tax=Kitasatospora sp. NPDC101801 TaxID=3364103 RepID=UPI003811AC0A
MGIVPDGNRRWARRHGHSVLEGHRRGADTTVRVLDRCGRAGVETVTVWALSLDNAAKRPELAGMLTVIIELADAVADRGWYLRVIGAPERLPDPAIRAALHSAEKRSAPGGLRVYLAVAYDGRQEIISAVQSLLAEHPAGSLDSQALTDRLSERGQPPCDLIIRTSGEQRLSGFLLWQSSTAELYFSPELWPDFTELSLNDALASYAGRQRRYGA